MQFWQVFLFLSVTFFIIGLVMNQKRRGGSSPNSPDNGAQNVSYTDVALESEGGEVSMRVPTEWNETFITQQLRQLRDEQPDLIPHFIFSIKERLVLTQDDRTAQKRLQYLQTQIEQLKLAKEFHQTILETTKISKGLELEIAQLEAKLKSHGQLEEMATQKEKKKIELEIAQLDKQIDDVKNSSQSSKPAQPSREEQRRQRRAKIHAEYAQLEKDEQEDLQLAKTDLERERIKNIYADLKRRKLDELAQP